MAKVKKVVGRKPALKHAEVTSHVKVEKLIKGKSEKELVLEMGVPLEDVTRMNPMSSLPLGKTLVGLAKGVTLNMGGYQSARVDCWIARVVDDTNKSVMDTLADLSQLISEHIEYESEDLEELKEK